MLSIAYRHMISPPYGKRLKVLINFASVIILIKFPIPYGAIEKLLAVTVIEWIPADFNSLWKSDQKFRIWQLYESLSSHQISICYGAIKRKRS